MVDNKIPTKPYKGVISIIENYLFYNEKTGSILFSKDFRYRKKGSVADINRNSLTAKNKYLCVSFYVKNKRVLVFSHHIAWFLKTGKWPENLIDHKDENGMNNKWKNLRIGNPVKNAINRKLQVNNTSGTKGVYLHKFTKKSSGKVYEYWYADIKVNGKVIYLGKYKTYDEAKLARLQAEKKYFGEWSYLNR